LTARHRFDPFVNAREQGIDAEPARLALRTVPDSNSDMMTSANEV
jgi:hypothetical protein